MTFVSYYEILRWGSEWQKKGIRNDNKTNVFHLGGSERAWFCILIDCFGLYYEILRWGSEWQKKGYSEWQQKEAQNDTKTTNCHLERSERSRFWWLDWLLIYVMRFFTHCAQKAYSVRSEWQNKTGGSQFKLWDSSLRSEWQQKDAQNDKNHVYRFLYKFVNGNVVKDLYRVVID